MRWFFPLLLLLVAAAPMAHATAPRRVASLNLCTDEYLLALAAPGQIASVTHLAQDPNESRWAGIAKRFGRNDGTIESVAGQSPDLIVTMGGAPDDRAHLADRLGARLLILPYPSSIRDVMTNMTTLAQALNRSGQVAYWQNALNAATSGAPTRLHPALFVTSEGHSIAPDGLSAEWMRIAGLRQGRINGTRISSEQLLTMTPMLLLHSRYRPGQMARSQSWSGLRLVRGRPGWQVMETDGRGWLCGGPAMISEIRRLQGVIVR